MLGNLTHVCLLCTVVHFSGITHCTTMPERPKGLDCTTHVKAELCMHR